MTELRQNTRAVWLALALVLAGVVWLYIPALGTQFFADDFLFLDQVRDRSLFESLRIPDPLSNFYRPISRQLYFWIIAGLTNESPVAFRVGNLFFLLVIVVLLFFVARRLAGERAGLIAAAVLGLHYTADVPVRWACGSQELLAVTFALTALLLYLHERRGWAGVALLFAALSKEVILLTPLIAIVADRRPGESWIATTRRAWPLAAAIAMWGGIWLLMPHARVAQSTEVEFDLVNSPLAAFAHLFRVVIGLEWRHGEFGHLPRVLPPVVPLVAAVSAIAIAWRAVPAQRSAGATAAPAMESRPGVARGKGKERGRRRGGFEMPRAVPVGIVWALVATLPVAAVAILWSAYYYLYALCGVAVLIGALLAKRHVAWALAAVVVLAWGSASARSLGEFGVGRDAWTPQSHINAHYIDRSNRIVDEYLASLQRAYPKLPKSSTLFFAGLKGNVAFQRGDGPLLRWAYRDSSLRGYYLYGFSRDKVGRGPVLVFLASGDTLREMERGDDLYLRLAFGMIVSDQPEGARDALLLAEEIEATKERARYWRAWTEWALGDTASARGLLGAGGASVSAGSGSERDVVLAAIAAGDTAGALKVIHEAVSRRPLDSGAHALLADLLLIQDRRIPEGAVEAYAARVLAPNDPYAWRRWAMIQTDRERHLQALESFEKYFALGGAAVQSDGEASKWMADIRAMLPGGDLAPEELRR